MSKKAWSPGRSRRSEKTCGCGLQRSPETALIASTCSEPSSNRICCARATISCLVHARAQHPVDLLVDGVDHPAGVVEQRDLLVGLDLARLEHHARAVGDLDSRALQRLDRDQVGHVDPERLALEAALAQLELDLQRERVGDPGLVRHRAAHRGDACAEALLRQPRREHPVVARRRAEVPQDGVVAAREEHPARVLVPRPLADVRARDVADVVRVEQEERAEVGLRERGSSPGRAGPRAAWRSRSAVPSRPPSWRRAMRCSSSPGSPVPCRCWLRDARFPQPAEERDEVLVPVPARDGVLEQGAQTLGERAGRCLAPRRGRARAGRP